jgi:hypothetical protein
MATSALCNRQVQDFIQNSQAFADAGTHLVMVYPGPPQDLGSKASEFLDALLKPRPAK